MRKFFFVFALVAAFGLVACTTQPTESGDSGATAPSSGGPAPASSCGGSGKG